MATRILSDYVRYQSELNFKQHERMHNDVSFDSSLERNMTRKHSSSNTINMQHQQIIFLVILKLVTEIALTIFHCNNPWNQAIEVNLVSIERWDY